MNQNNSIRIIPLGGLGQIGMNCLVLETSTSAIILDCGISFSQQNELGIEFYHPCFDYIQSIKEKIKAILVTHGHEDHFAAIPFLLKKINVPIYLLNYSAKLLKKRLREFNITGDCNLICPGKPFDIHEFSITAFLMPHSIIDNCGYAIKVNDQTIIHTSDFKLDIFNPDNYQTTCSILDNFKAPDLLLTDSTGSLESTKAGCEKSLEQSLISLIKKRKGRIFTAIFSSNIYRLEVLSNVAKATDRKIVLNGRSVLTHFEAAKGYALGLDFEKNLISSKMAQKQKPENSLIILSGTQGEKNSALGRLAYDRNSEFKIQKGDLVIFSSRFIPGNELKISKIINKLLQKGADVYHCYNTEGIHVSGHGGKEEIFELIQRIKPSNLLPVHGTLEHLKEVEKLAQIARIKTRTLLENGTVAVLCNGTLDITEEKVAAQKVPIGNGQKIDLTVLKERKIIGANGFILVKISSQTQIEVFSIGVFQAEKRYDFEQKLNFFLNKKLEEIYKEANLSDLISLLLKKHLKKQYSCSPLIRVEQENFED